MNYKRLKKTKNKKSIRNKNYVQKNERYCASSKSVLQPPHIIYKFCFFQIFV